MEKEYLVKAVDRQGKVSMISMDGMINGNMSIFLTKFKCDRCGCEAEIYAPYLKIVGLISESGFLIEKAKKIDAKLIEYGVIDSCKEIAIKNNKEFVDGTSIKVYRCKCGNEKGLDIEARIKRCFIYGHD